MLSGIWLTLEFFDRPRIVLLISFITESIPEIDDDDDKSNQSENDKSEVTFLFYLKVYLRVFGPARSHVSHSILY